MIKCKYLYLLPALLLSACADPQEQQRNSECDEESCEGDAERQAYAEFLDELPAALCRWWVSCGFISSEERSDCVSRTTPLVEEAMNCTRGREAYASDASGLNACLNGSFAVCDGSDDFKDFCPGAVDLHEICTDTGTDSGNGGSGGNDASSTPECSSDSACPSGEACQSGSCVTVECTTDTHCGSCAICSSHTCRDCGSGPNGCYFC